MDLDDPAQLRSELARLYRALEDKEAECHKIKKQNEKLKSNLEINTDAQVQGGAAAKKIIELGLGRFFLLVTLKRFTVSYTIWRQNIIKTLRFILSLL